LRVEGPWLIRLYASLPLRAASRLWGTISSATVPLSLRPLLYGAYARVFDCNLDEAEVPDLAAYPSLGDFFYRRLRDGARPLAAGAELVVPADGRVLALGELTGGALIPHIKGGSFSLKALLGAHPAPALDRPEPPLVLSPAPAKGNSFHYCVIYLAPGDYHRFHSPAVWNVESRRHFAGELLSVSPAVYEKIRNLFVLNERVALTGTWQHGFFSMIPVGATNVGGIRIDFDPELHTNAPESAQHPIGTFVERRFPGRGVALRRGDAVGGFRMGSTVVLVFEARQGFQFSVREGEKVRVGQMLGQ
ncbi:phosphatidylserine decarboxylase 1, partial [Cladochytrium tenue]